MAEMIFRQRTGESDVISAGTHVFERENEQLGDFAPAKETLEVLRELGIDASKNVRNQITEAMAKSADRIVVLESRDTLPEYVTGVRDVIYWDVDDPYQMNVDQTREVRDTILSFVKTLDS